MRIPKREPMDIQEAIKYLEENFVAPIRKLGPYLENETHGHDFRGDLGFHLYFSKTGKISDEQVEKLDKYWIKAMREEDREFDIYYVHASVADLETKWMINLHIVSGPRKT